MHRGRVSIRAMIAGLAAIGLTLGSLRGATDLWWIATLLATLGLLAWATLGAIVLRGPERVPWLGVALFGWIFFAMTHTNRIFPDFSYYLFNGFKPLGQIVHPEPKLIDEPTQLDFNETFRIRAENEARATRTQMLRGNFGSSLILITNVCFALLGWIAGKAFAARIVQNIPAPNLPAYTIHHREEAP